MSFNSQDSRILSLLIIIIIIILILINYDPIVLRRSTRSTADWNNNLFNEPRSVLLSQTFKFRETVV